VSRTWPFAVTLMLTLVGCGTDREAAAGPLEFDVNQAFPLGGGQEATITGENLLVRFSDVLEDSRCPKAVECFWTGEARIVIRVEDHGEPTTVEFNTNPAPGQNVQLSTVGAHTVALWSLDPYPQSPDQVLKLTDYRATLLVQNS
jgi:hypothetical protein